MKLILLLLCLLSLRLFVWADSTPFVGTVVQKTHRAAARNPLIGIFEPERFILRVSRRYELRNVMVDSATFRRTQVGALYIIN